MTQKTSLLPNPQQLQLFKEVDPRLPELIVSIQGQEARHDFWYALAGMLSSSVLFLSVVGAFVYLVMHDHPKAAGTLLGAGVLGLIQAMLRSRLRSPDKSKDR
jgi:hypothetical protein